MWIWNNSESVRPLVFYDFENSSIPSYVIASTEVLDNREGRVVLDGARYSEKTIRSYEILHTPLKIPLVSKAVAKVFEGLCGEKVQIQPVQINCKKAIVDGFSFIRILSSKKLLNKEVSKFDYIPKINKVIYWEVLVFLEKGLDSSVIVQDQLTGKVIMSDSLGSELAKFDTLGDTLISSNTIVNPQ